jgi:spore germination protein KB
LHYLPQVSTPPANQDVWISILLSAVYSFILALPALYLSMNSGCCDDGQPGLFGNAKTILGGVAGRVIIILYILFFLYESAILILNISNFTFFTLLSASPEYITAILFLLSGAYLSAKGIEAISRFSTIIAPVALLLILLLIGSEASSMDLSRLLPVLRASTLKDIHTGALSGAANNTDIIALALLAPRISGDKRGKIPRSFAVASAISTVILAITAISVQAAFGAVMAAKYRYPLYSFLKLANYHFFLQSIESVSVLLWVIGSCGVLGLYMRFVADGVEAMSSSNAAPPAAETSIWSEQRTPKIKIEHLTTNGEHNTKRAHRVNRSHRAKRALQKRNARKIIISAATAVAVFAGCAYFRGNIPIQPELLLSYEVNTFVKLPFIFFIPLIITAAYMARRLTKPR